MGLRALLVIGLLALGAGRPAEAGEIAITLDDLPYLTPSKITALDGQWQVGAVIDALAKHDITATGFVIGGQVNARTLSALEAFVAAGHTLGNHSWTHSDYGTQYKWQFRRETVRTDRALQPWLGAVKYYRFPYLREGETPRAVGAAKDVLEDLGYVNARVSIDNHEWKYNAEYVEALNGKDTDKAEEIATRYLAHMKERTAHYQALAKARFGREVKHILLLHMNKINADHLEALLEWYADEGWQFITLAEALSDPIYGEPDVYVGPEGLSHLERIAATVRN